MRLRTRNVLMMALIVTLQSMVVFAQGNQGRKFGPEVGNSILEARLDPTFQTTKMSRIALLPFANTIQYKEGAALISKNFLSELSQMHSEYKFVPPEETINFISKSGLDDNYNIFLGDYLNSGTARQDFIDILRNKLQIDAVFLGQISGWGEKKASTFLSGKNFVVGMEMSLYRTSDGRRIWYGKDLIIVKKESQLQEAAQIMSQVFARFFGRTQY